MGQARIVESPCISVCVMNDQTGFCEGCWRTRDEIAIWARADSDTRLAILEELHERRVAAGGRSRRQTSRRPQR